MVDRTIKKAKERKKISRETGYNEERYYGHGLKERNTLRNATENKIRKNIT